MTLLSLMTLKKAALLGLCVVAASCGSTDAASDGTFPAAAYATVASTGGKLRVEIRTAPQPPTRGTMRIELRVFDAATGVAQEGLTVDAVPWMPAMGHGTSVKPQVSIAKEGTYVLDGVSMFMPGRWELRIDFSGKVVDRVVPTLDIP